MDTFENIQEIFSEVLGVDDLILKPEMTTGDIDGWDSFVNVEVLLMCEKKFKIKFNSSQIELIKSVNDLVNAVNKANNVV